MPKLSAGASKLVDATEARHETGSGGDFAPHPAGRYLAKLSDVSARDNLNKHGMVMWNAEFQNLISLETETPVPGRQWLQLTLPADPKKGVPATYVNGPEKWEKYQAMVLGQLHAFFESFGYTSDSDTDELLGEWAIIELAIVTAQAGKNEGKQVNEIAGIYPVPEDLDLEALGVSANGADEEAF